uniref:Anti-anti-sigma factor n=1 Tax=uncultured Thiotrichaceae bacterium TaxID=298394 RepID=A0A6S6TIP4_9GAMM|nr:MAG: Anti-anti-sigma factor [uncultured Thiotrichaceae bacterium]
MAENSIHISNQDQTTLITLKGLLDNELAASLSNAIEKTTPPVILDMKQVSFISAIGSLTLLNFYTEHQQKPIIKDANQSVLDMLKLSGTARYVEVAEKSDDSDSPTPSVQE